MSDGNKPITSRRLGKFQISSWCFNRIRKARNDFDAERQYEVIRTCVQYSRYNRRTGAFERQQIWCDPYELRDLAALLDGLGDEPESAAQPAVSEAVCNTA
jgi:hypothetical protein